MSCSKQENQDPCFRLLLFTEINISQSSVATRWRSGGIFGDHLNTNLLLSLPVIEFWQEA